jgi:hypothetical protein
MGSCEVIVDAPPALVTPDLAPGVGGRRARRQAKTLHSRPRRSPLLEAVHEYAALKATQFNVAYALYQLGETEAAFEELHKTLALNERYGQRDDQVENYRTMLEWQSPDGEVDETQVDRYAERLVPHNVKFQFGWVPFDATVSATSTRDVYRNEAPDRRVRTSRRSCACVRTAMTWS